MGNQDNPRTGVFATRSPVRPNLIALTLCKIVAVKNNVIQIERTDAFDGTPVLDIKPFIPGYDTTEDAKMPDWLERARKQQPKQASSAATDDIESLAATMAKIDRACDNLNLCQEATWTSPKTHPDLVPALQAFLVREGLHESRENLAEGHDDRCKAWLTEAEKVADGLGQAVLSGNRDRADRQFEVLMRSCKQCHAEYRN